MKRSVLAILSVFTVSISAFAQMAPPKPQYFLVHEETVRPSMVMQYEVATKDILNAFTEKKADPKVFGMNLYMTNDFHYLFLVPISSWAALDVFQNEWTKIGAAVGKDKWHDLMTRSNDAMYSYDEIVIVQRPDLSYVAANPRMKPEEHRFFHLIYYYLDAAHADDAEQIAKDYAALFKAKNITTGFNVFQALSGEGLPLLVVSVPAKSASDYYVADEAINAALGKDVLPLQARALAITRKFKVRDVVHRPELSYQPK